LRIKEQETRLTLHEHYEEEEVEENKNNNNKKMMMMIMLIFDGSVPPTGQRFLVANFLCMIKILGSRSGYVLTRVFDKGTWSVTK
jgi:hypothetical protein